MIVILRPLRKSAWANVVRYRNCHEDITPYLTRSGRTYTGLTPADEERLGKALGGIDLKAAKQDGSPSEFWTTFYIRTGAKDVYLDTNDPMDELRYLFLKNHKRVSPSIFERKATANFVLVNKQEEAKKANVYARTKRQAIREFDKMSPEDIRKALRLYGHNADKMSNEVAENALFDIIEGNSQGFINKWVNNANRETEVLIERAISKNIIRKNKNIYRYGTDLIGNSLYDTIDFLDNPKNQDIKRIIIDASDSKDFVQPGGFIEKKKVKKSIDIPSILDVTEIGNKETKKADVEEEMAKTVVKERKKK